MNEQQDINTATQTQNLSNGNTQLNTQKKQNSTTQPAVSKSIMIFAGIIVILIIGVLTYSFINQKKSREQTISEDITAIPTTFVKNGEINKKYLDYSQENISLAENHQVLLLFMADWCVSCKQLDIDILNNISTIPDEILILKVNYESDTQTKDKYQVDTPHTVVLIDNQGNELKRWIGSLTLDALIKESPLYIKSK